MDEDILAYKINDRQTGFYRVRYSDMENLDELGKRVLEKSLPPEDRWGLESDFFALVKSGGCIPGRISEIHFLLSERRRLPAVDRHGRVIFTRRIL